MQQPERTARARLVHALLLGTLFAGAFHLQGPQAPPELYLGPETLVGEEQATGPALPDFASIHDVDLKKRTFFDFLQPYVDAKNTQIQRQRQRLLGLVEKMAVGYVLDHQEVAFLYELAREYEVETDNIRDPAFLDLLLRRVDVIPPSLVLAQAANESAWGTSRFAKEGYNFFGQWCYTEGCGLVPKRRRASASHEVKSFASIEEAVNAYFLNLNTFPSYQYMRLIRQDLRRRAQPIDGLALSEGLRSYSERGEAYISELRSMIRHNDLLHRDQYIIQ